MNNELLAALTADPILSEVVKLFVAQQEKGLEKYGELVNLDSYSLVGWMEHAQQAYVDKKSRKFKRYTYV
ncbi:hypothetical protein GK047_04735 [Paenibacillus sp. SYP-B3998]|uniref:Uncharacterized protein n=1 Tax=Paenibacillus sp. SYP-B3998 TaxID=2678564 RepID=A0A6G3ZSY6_9BACL|nr:hypothetical protein [Paenibacillus sp. SYP-B3998]NEW05326.1 hypothetical protein [Paenibacillus sp. SYP-B3998]